MVSTLLMLERTLRGFHATSPDHDAEILEDCRRTVREILEDAELRLWDLDDAGWRAPDDDDCVTYTARLLLCCTRLSDLTTAIQTAQEITFTPGERQGTHTAPTDDASYRQPSSASSVSRKAAGQRLGTDLTDHPDDRNPVPGRGGQGQ